MPPGPAPDLIGQEVDGDTVAPCREAGLASERVELAQDTGQGVVRDVFGDGLIAVRPERGGRICLTRQVGQRRADQQIAQLLRRGLALAAAGAQPRW